MLTDPRTATAPARGITIVIPVYNGAATLRDLVVRLHPVLAAQGVPFEVIMVNDGSRDASWSVVQALAAEQAWVRGANLMRNFGQQNALLCGIRLARFDVTVTIDDDLQNPPEEIPRLLQALAGSCDVVYGTPEKNRHGLWRNLATLMTKLAFQNAISIETARQVSAFRAFRTALRDAFAAYRSPAVSIDALLMWGTARLQSVTVRHDARQSGASNYTLGKLIRHALTMMTGFSTVPLRLASLTGFAFTGFGGLVLAYVVVRFVIQGGVVPGFAFLASIIAIFSGVQLFALGIIGEYLAHVHLRALEKPPYVVLEMTPTPAEPAHDD